MKQIKMKCIGYARASTDKQDISLEVQEEKIRQFVDLKDGYELLEIYSEQASGADMEREGLREALSALEEGADALVIYRLDRIARSVSGFFRDIEDHFQENELVSIEESIDTSTPMGEFVRNIFLSVAQFERDMTIKRVNDAIEQKRENGEWLGNAPWGYKEQDGYVVEDEYEQRALDRMIQLREEGHTYQEIEDEMAVEGWQNRSGNPLNKGTINRILRDNLEEA